MSRHVLILVTCLSAGVSRGQFQGGYANGAGDAGLMQNACSTDALGFLFEGGPHLGMTFNSLIVVNCSVVAWDQAYAGGTNDGTSSVSLVQVDCPGTVSDPIFNGGIQDGAANSMLVQVECPIPGSVERFAGGLNDGAAASMLIQLECPDPAVLDHFAGGVNDGHANGTIVQSECPGPNVADIFAGGLNDGADAAIAVQGECAPVIPEIWSGGDMDGSAKGINEQTICPNTTPLPIELMDWQAGCEDGAVALRWTTAVEIDNAYFTVERSIDLEQWELLIQVEAEGNSTHLIDYEVWDEQPLSGLTYYRLSQTDVDGTRSVFRSIPTTCTQKDLTLLIYPNPNRGRFTVELQGSEELLEIIVRSSSGTTVQHSTEQRDRLVMDLSNEASGIYFVSVLTQQGVLQERVVVER